MDQTINLDPCVAVARDAGCPMEQVVNFLSVGYIPLPKQWQFHAAARACDDDGGPTDIGLGGARGPGKTTGVFNQVCMDDCVRAPGIKFLFLRCLQKSAAESFEELIREQLHSMSYEYNSSRLMIKFSNGSYGLLGGYHEDRDISKYIGQQYDLIVVEEATTIKPGTMTYIKGSLRSGKSMADGRRWRPRIYYTTNPGGVGHLEFKQQFVEPYRQGTETTTRFIPCNYKDNPFLNREYVDYLEGLTGDLAKMWRDGDWDVFEGQAFPTWRHDRHVIEPFEIPAHWVRKTGTDWGYAKPFCTLWGAVDPDTGRVYIYREVYEAGLSDQTQARTVNQYSVGENIVRYFADPSMWTKSEKQQGFITSTADEYRAEGVILTQAQNDRMAGKRKVDRLLSDMPDGKPGLQVFSTCYNLIRTLPSLPYDKTHVEDVDTDAEDHAYDSLRYLLSDIRDPAKQKEKPERQHPLKTARYL